MVIPSTDANFNTFLPGCIDYSEQRIYRELDLLYTQVVDNTKAVSSGNRSFTLSTAIGTFLTVDQFNIITPALVGPGAGTRVPLIPCSPQFLDAAWPGNVSSAFDVPEYYAMRSNTLVLLGPPPDQPYFAETIGIQRPSPLSSGNSSTILTQYIPDVFMAACMVFATGYQRDFGSQADNPQMGAAWEAQYQLLIKSAAVENFRAKFQSQGWTSDQPSPLVQRS
jgi:hypothetical protein